MDLIMLDFDFKLLSKSNEKLMNRGGRFTKSRKNREFEEHVSTIAMLRYMGKPVECDLEFTIHARFKNKVHGDAQNLFKSVCDALEGIIYKNDRQIKIATIRVEEGFKKNDFSVFIKEARNV